MSNIIGFNPTEDAISRMLWNKPEPGAWYISSETEAWHSLNEHIKLPVLYPDYQGNDIEVFLYSDGSQKEHSDLSIVRKNIRTHAFRICPWARFWLAPAWFGSNGWLGRAWPDMGIILLKTHADADSMLTLFAHEIWHLLEWYMPSDVLAELDEEIANGPKYGKYYGGWDSEPTHYLSLKHERRARAFARIAMLTIDGIQLPCQENAYSNRGYQILCDAWNGKYSNIAMRNMEQNKEGSLNGIK